MVQLSTHKNHVTLQRFKLDLLNLKINGELFYWFAMEGTFLFFFTLISNNKKWKQTRNFIRILGQLFVLMSCGTD